MAILPAARVEALVRRLVDEYLVGGGSLLRFNPALTFSLESRLFSRRYVRQGRERPLVLASGETNPGLLVMADAGGALEKFVCAIGKHRHFERHADPPMV